MIWRYNTYTITKNNERTETTLAYILEDTHCVHTRTVLTTHTTQPVNARKRAPLSDEKTGD